MARVESERVQLRLLQDCVNIGTDTKGLPESLLGSDDDDHPIQSKLWLPEMYQSINALCSYPLKLGSPKFLKVKAQFSLNFVPNFKILVLTG